MMIAGPGHVVDDVLRSNPFNKIVGAPQNTALGSRYSSTPGYCTEILFKPIELKQYYFSSFNPLGTTRFQISNGFVPISCSKSKEPINFFL